MKNRFILLATSLVPFILILAIMAAIIWSQSINAYEISKHIKNPDQPGDANLLLLLLFGVVAGGVLGLAIGFMTGLSRWLYRLVKM